MRRSRQFFPKSGQVGRKAGESGHQLAWRFSPDANHSIDITNCEITGYVPRDFLGRKCGLRKKSGGGGHDSRADFRAKPRHPSAAPLGRFPWAHLIVQIPDHSAPGSGPEGHYSAATGPGSERCSSFDPGNRNPPGDRSCRRRRCSGHCLRTMCRANRRPSSRTSCTNHTYRKCHSTSRTSDSTSCSKSRNRNPNHSRNRSTSDARKPGRPRRSRSPTEQPSPPAIPIESCVPCSLLNSYVKKGNGKKG